MGIQPNITLFGTLEKVQAKLHIDGGEGKLDLFDMAGKPRVNIVGSATSGMTLSDKTGPKVFLEIDNDGNPELSFWGQDKNPLVDLSFYKGNPGLTLTGKNNISTVDLSVNDDDSSLIFNNGSENSNMMMLTKFDGSSVLKFADEKGTDRLILGVTGETSIIGLFNKKGEKVFPQP